MKALLLLFTLLQVSSTILIGQKVSITGYIRDYISNEGINTSLIEIQGKNSLTYSDKSGLFKIKTVLPTTLVITKTGYLSHIQEITTKDTVQILLKKILVLDTLVLFSNKNPNFSLVHDFSLSRNNLMQSGYPTVQQSLHFLTPNFNSYQVPLAYESSLTDPYYYNNMGPDNVKILINGIPKASSSLLHYFDGPGKAESGIEFSSIAKYSVDSIFLTTSSFYDDKLYNTPAGIINIKLSKNDSTTTINAEAGISRKEDAVFNALNINTGFKLYNKYSTNLNFSIINQNGYNRSGTPINEQLFEQSDTSWIKNNPSLGMNIGGPIHNYGVLTTSTEISLNKLLDINLTSNSLFKKSESTTFYLPPYILPRNSVFSTNGIGPNYNGTISDQLFFLKTTSKISNLLSHEGLLKLDYNNNSYEIDNTIAYDSKSISKFKIGSLFLTNKYIGSKFKFNFNNAHLIIDNNLTHETYKLNNGNSSIKTNQPQSFEVAGALPYFIKDSISSKRTTINSSISFIKFINNYRASLLFSILSSKVYSPQISLNINQKLLLGNSMAFEANLSTGKRIPSLQQILFSNNHYKIQYRFGDLIDPFAIRRNISSFDSTYIRQNLLKPESYKKLIVSSKVNFSSQLNFTIAYSYIEITDKIIYSSDFHPYMNPLLDIYDNDLESARIISNLLNITYNILNTSIKYKLKTNSIIYNFNFLGYYNHTKIKSINNNLPNFNKLYQTDVFNEIESSRLTGALPNIRLHLLAEIHNRRIILGFINNYFGSVRLTHSNYTQIFRPLLTSDAFLKYKISKKIDLHLNANNIFNVFPDENRKGDQLIDLGQRIKYSTETSQINYIGLNFQAGLHISL